MEQKKIDELNGSYLRNGQPADRGHVAGKHLKDFDADLNVEELLPHDRYMELAQNVLDAFKARPKLELKPGDPENCPGLGLDPDIECQCDECDYLMECCGKFPRGSVPREAMADATWFRK